MQDREAPAVERRDVELRIEPGGQGDHRRHRRIVRDLHGDCAAHREADERDLLRAGSACDPDRSASILDAERQATPGLDPVAHLQKRERNAVRRKAFVPPFTQITARGPGVPVQRASAPVGRAKDMPGL